MLKDFSKKSIVIALAIIILVGSFISFYAGNLLMSDLSNMFYGVHDMYIISSFPMALLILYFVLAFLYIIRYYRYKEYRVRLTKLYLIYLMIISGLGIVFSCLTGTIIYHNMLAPYPFFGHTIIMLLIHLVVLSLSILSIIKVSKIKDDVPPRKFRLLHVLNTIFLVVLLVMAYYRFGSFLWMPIYVQTRTLYLTIWFYIWILIPICVVIHLIIYYLDIYKSNKTQIIFTSILVVLHFTLGIVVISLMRSNPVFISAISPALPLERLATSPIDTYVEFFGIGIITIYYLLFSIRRYLLKK